VQDADGNVTFIYKRIHSNVPSGYAAMRRSTAKLASLSMKTIQVPMGTE
jgi:hypothetical protein